jgi:lipopolysaccharide/colanic/teichoic acid biosynthesis glycosyltransferase
MSELIATSSMQRSFVPVESAIGDAQLGAASQLETNNLQERVRELVGSGWVDQLELRGETRSEILAGTVDAARLAARRVKFVFSGPISDLPPPLEGERLVKEEIAGETAFTLIPHQRATWKLAVKRLGDIAVSVTLLVLLFPALLVVAIAVLVTSGAPVLYQWRVLGENGRPFIGYKFRTMVRDADELKPQLQHLNERSGPVFKIAKDPRVTPLGRWLRKHSLDELPQLWSVLVGDMSLVGPRPVFPSEYRDFELWQMRKLSVKPGLTCIWQIDGRERVTDLSDWARLDLQYIDNWSLWQDLQLLVRTPLAIFKGTGH